VVDKLFDGDTSMLMKDKKEDMEGALVQPCNDN